MSQASFDHYPNSEPPYETIENKVEHLMAANADFTFNTTENGFAKPGEFPDSYRALAFEYLPDSSVYAHVPRIIHDLPLEEGQPPFTNKPFYFQLLEKRDDNSEFANLPQWKILMPIDSRRHFGYGRIEFYLDNQGEWRSVKHDLRPTQDAVRQSLQTNTAEHLGAMATVMQGYEDAGMNAELAEGLVTVLGNCKPLPNPQAGEYKGIFMLTNTIRFQEQRIKENWNQE
jgi:hypothetical protein